VKSKGEILIYQTAEGKSELAVKFERDTLWLNQSQLTDVFETDRTSILKHIQNIYETGELPEKSTCAKFAQVQKEGSRLVTRQILYYNLDMILSVGYRVNAKRGTQFRIWATKVLRDHLIKGYTVNQNRLRDLNQAVRLVAGIVERKDLSGDEAKALLRVVGEYSRALDLLDDYDHQRLAVPVAAGKVVHMLTYEEALRIVERLRERFSDSALFGMEKDKGLASALGAVMQTFDGADLYPSLEEKAAHLLYFLIKNHAFVDGNKRIAAALFLWFLERNAILVADSGERLISDAALVAMTLMIAESHPKEKEVLVRIVTHLLCDKSQP
jgi:death-on-curing family protein